MLQLFCSSVTKSSTLYNDDIFQFLKAKPTLLAAKALKMPECKLLANMQTQLVNK